VKHFCNVIAGRFRARCRLIATGDAPSIGRMGAGVVTERGKRCASMLYYSLHE